MNRRAMLQRLHQAQKRQLILPHKNHDNREANSKPSIAVDPSLFAAVSYKYRKRGEEITAAATDFMASV